jgi:conjugal transfer pilus assembly protein TraK
MRFFLYVFFSINLFFLSSIGYAMQIKSMQDNETALFKISANQLNRIFVDNDRIESLRGLSGNYQLLKDEKVGAVFIKPQTNYAVKPFNVFVSTEKGHSYTLFLTPVLIPAQTIKIMPASPVKEKATAWEKSASYQDILIQLINGMAKGEAPDGYAFIYPKKNTVHKISDNLSIQLLAIYEGSQLQGEVWQVNNHCHDVQLHLSAFYQENIRALALKDHQLSQCESTLLYRVVDNVEQ